jgi:hypothetical protein
VRLTVEGHSYTQPFEVVKDPKIKTSDAVLRDSTALQVQIADAISETSDMVNAMEKWRKQIEEHLKTHASGSNADALQRLDAQILEVENQLVSPEARLSDDKQYSTPFRMYWSLRWLAGRVGQGIQNTAGGSDYAPTVVERNNFAKLQGQLADARTAFDNLKATTLPAFNRDMRGNGIKIDVGG